MSSVVVCYFFQGELGESMETPNAFIMNASANDLSFGQFLNEFPLPSIDLHFRFRKEDSSCGYVWQDMASHADTIPLYQGSIFVKILRLGDASAMRRRSRLKLKQHVVNSGGSFTRSAPAMSSAGARKSASPPARSSPGSSASFNSSPSAVFEASHSPFDSPADGGPAFPATTPAAAEPNMFASFDAPVAESAPSDGSILSVPIPITNKKYTTVNAYVPDADDIDDEPYSGSSAPAESTTAPAPVVIDLMADMSGVAGLDSGSGASLDESKSEALKQKRDLDRKREKEAEEGDESRKKLQGVVTKWATNNGEKRNVRTLLSTLHTIITWTSWKPLNLGDVMEAKKVKLHYRKAMIIVHPDKNSSFNSDQKYLGQRAFECLNEAYNEFETKESVA